MKARGVFIAGTDTGVGKTVVSCLLTEALRTAGRSVGVMKPYAAGGWEDTDALIRAAGGGLSRADVTPVFYRKPLAPGVRGLFPRQAKAGFQRLDGKVPFPPSHIHRREALGRREFSLILDRFQRLRKTRDAVVVEGIGGVLVPLAGRLTAADLARRLALPVWIVARPSLGTLNHTLLTVEALRRRRLSPARIVLSGFTGADEVQRTNPVLLSRLTGLSITLLPRIRSAAQRRQTVSAWARSFGALP